MSKYDDLLAGKDQTIWYQRYGLLVLTVVTLLCLAGWMNSPSNIRVHIPPDLSYGSTLKIGEVSKPNVYGFGVYILTALYRWPSSGKENYLENIERLRPYMTSSCYQDRMDDYRFKKSSIHRRERGIWEIPGRGYNDDRVRIVAANKSWIISLDMGLKESMHGEDVKSQFANYQLRVVSHTSDPEYNPWGLAIDCFVRAPVSIDLESS